MRNIFDSAAYLGLVADESTNITGERINSISVIYKNTLYNWSTESLGDKNATAEQAVEDINKAALEVMNGDLKRLSSFTSDTCATMQSVWEKVHLMPSLAHVFNVGCDSHGSQLIIKDIIDPGKIQGEKIQSEIHDFWKDF